MPTDQQALHAINRITGDDFCESLDMNSDNLSGELKTAHEKLALIYRIAHSMDRSCKCHHVHTDWRMELAELIS